MKTKTATIMLKTDKIGSTVLLKRVTPAEVMFLVADFHPLAGGDPIVKIEESEDDVEYDPARERNRLMGKYGANRIKKFYPNPIPTLPETFESARNAGVASEAPTERLLTVGDTPGAM